MKKVAFIFILAAIIVVFVCGCEKKAATVAVTPSPSPTATPEPTPTPKIALDKSSLDKYSDGEISSIVEFADGSEIITSYISENGGETAIFHVTDGIGKALCVCGGEWFFEVVEGSEEYPCTLFTANFVYGELDSYDRYAYSLFMYEKEKGIFGTYLSKPATNAIVVENEYSKGMAWVLWGEYNETYNDYILPIDLTNGSRRYTGVVEFESDELLFMAELNDLDSHVYCRMDADESDPEGLYITKFHVDADGNEIVVGKYRFSLYSKSFERIN